MRRQSLTAISVLSLALSCACSLVVDADGAALGELASSGDGAGSPGDGSPGGACSADPDCSDDDPCNGDERCDPDAPGADAQTGCAPGEPPDCSDDIGCTRDACEPGKGCTHSADSTRCADDVACTVDVCDVATGCEHLPNDTRCDFCRSGASCDVNEGCVGGTIDNTCTDGDACTVDQCDVATAQCLHAGSCESGPDACDTAEDVRLNAGRGLVGGLFTRVAATYDVACGERSTPDAVYHVRVDEVSDIILDSTLSDAATILAVATDCSSEGFGLACAETAGGVSSGARLIIHRYDPAVQGPDLFVLVDALSRNNSGEYVLTVDVLPVAPDQCDGEVLTVAGTATVLGFMDARQPPNGWGESAGTCQAANETVPEAVLRVAGAEDGTVELTVRSDEFDPVLYARRRCDGGGDNEELACASTLLPVLTDEVSIEFQADENDEAFVFVDGGGDGASYLLRTFP